MLCKRCNKKEAVEGKKNCVACAKYMSEYMKKKRSKKKVDYKLFPKGINAVSVKPPMVLNENPVRSFDVVSDSVLKRLKGGNNSASTSVGVEKNDNISPEALRYFYFALENKVFRGNKIACVKALIKVLEKELK